jgi:hemolysin III
VNRSGEERDGTVTATDQVELGHPVKPRWRGASHLVAFFVALIAGPVLVAQATTSLARVTATVYAVSLIALFGCSALLHRFNWSPRTLPTFRRIDHSMIFVFIAGTYTPVSLLSLSSGAARLVLIAVWTGAVAGVAITVFWIDAPRWVTAASYVVVGWIAVLAIPALWSALGAGQFALLAAGGVLYTLGSAVYASRRPDPIPHVFGYHEVFHALVIAAVACHYVLITQLVRE